MLIYAYNQGAGFGNVVFAQFAAILFAILFDGKIVNILDINKIPIFKTTCIEINDLLFIDIINAKINNNKTIIDINKNYYLSGYYQHDLYYVKYKKEIIQYITTNPNNTLFASHYPNPYKLIDIIENINYKIYDIVVHLRLGDFIGLTWVMNPIIVTQLLEKLIISPEQKICIVLEKPTTEIEFKYICYKK